MPSPCYGLGRRAYGGDAAVGPAVRGVRAYGGADSRPSGRGCVRARATRAERALGHARPREARARMPGPAARGRRRAARGARDVARGGALAQVVSLVLPLK
jgi:hypothetical protein